jgi:hypothetical protein
MKKVVLTFVMAMFMSMGFAQSDFNFDVRRLANKLQLNQEQVERVELISENMFREIDDAENLNGFEKSIKVRKAINKDIRSMRSILDDNQFNEYVVLLITTLKNNVYNEFINRY